MGQIPKVANGLLQNVLPRNFERYGEAKGQVVWLIAGHFLHSQGLGVVTQGEGEGRANARAISLFSITLAAPSYFCQVSIYAGVQMAFSSVAAGPLRKTTVAGIVRL